jgi:hypothetical protein
MTLLDGSSTRTNAGRDTVTGKFLPGHRHEYKTRYSRLDTTLQALYGAYEADSDADKILLALAAVHLHEAATARTSVKRTRESNAARRLLDRVKRRPERRPTLAEALEV